MTVKTVFDDLWGNWGFEAETNVTAFLRDRTVNTLNSAMQLIWSNAKEMSYFARETITVTVNSSGIASLDDDIQTVIGPVRVTSTNQPLLQISSRGAYERFGLLFGDSPTISSGTPQFYFLEENRQATADSVRLRILTVPAPASTASISVDVIKQPTRYTYSDYASQTVIAVPHNYEAILLPVVRKLGLGTRFFVDKGRESFVEQDYQNALAVLSGTSPRVTPKEAKAK